MQLENLLLALLRFEFFGKDLTETERQDLLGLGEEESKKLFILSLETTIYTDSKKQIKSKVKKNFVSKHLLIIARRSI